MKIGILTFQNANNYGALLQAYALKYALIHMGHQTHLINYFCSPIQKPAPLITLRTLKGIIKTPFRLILHPMRKRIFAKFTSFRKNYLTDTYQYYPETLSQISSYDLFITGSDQVFNPRITGFDPNYFLAFSKDTSKNASYAASFGFELKDLSAQEKQFIQQNIPHLKHLSVREQQGKKIIHSLTGQAAHVHIDPTLLLT